MVHRDGRVLRELSPRGVEAYEAFAASSLAGDERIVATTRVDETTLEHERVPFVSYPYEWPFGMLKAAALLQLDLLDAAIAEGLSIKDATPYNVQWVGGRPVFIDVGSFERLRPDEPWAGYRQFCCLYLYPLMLTAYRGVDFQPWLRGSLEGIEPSVAAALLPRWRRGVTINARLLARLERRVGSGAETRGRLARAGYKPELIRAQVQRLERLVQRLAPKADESVWSGYERAAYSEVDLAAKHAFVERAAERVRPTLTFDLGSNDGAFAPRHGLTVAIDSDPHVYSEGSSERAVLPLVIDICDPSPARGWALMERKSLTDRGRPDLTLSLALVHHLAITRNIPPDPIVAWLKSLGGTHVIEVPHRDDPMVQRLLAAKPTHFPYDLASFTSAVQRHFEVLHRQELSSRTLIECR